MPLMEPMRLGMRRSGSMSDLSPEEEDSLVRSAARAGLSGLGKVGNLLDTPGSIVRDLLTWLPGGPAPVNPIDQLWSPLSGENRTSGRQLLEGYGMRANRETGMGGWLNDPGEGLRDVAGFATEVLTDPLTWLTGGATAVGRGAKPLSKMGLLDDLTREAAKKGIGPRVARLTNTVDDLVGRGGQEAFDRVSALAKERNVPVDEILREPVGGLAGVKFTDKVLGTGPAALKVAEVLDKWSPNVFGELGSKFRQTAPGRLSAALMSAPNMGRVTNEVQPFAQDLFQRQTQGQQQVMGQVLDWAKTLEKHGMLDGDSAARVRSVGERALPASADPSGVGSTIEQALASSRAGVLARGRPRGHLEDDAIEGYITRHTDPTTPPGTKLPMGSSSSGDVNRLEALKGNYEGTSGVNRMFSDPIIDRHIRAQELTGVKKSDIEKSVADLLKQRYANNVIGEYRARGNKGEYLFEGGVELSPAKVAQGSWKPDGSWELVDGSGAVVQTLKPVLRNRMEDISAMMVNRPEWRASGPFTRHPVLDAMDRLKTDSDQMRADDVFYEFAGKHAKVGGEGMTLGDMFRERGLDADEATDVFAKRWRGLDLKSLPPSKDVDEMRRTIRKMRIDERVANDFLKPIPEYKVPDALEPVLKGVDSLTNFFKAGVLTWPSRYVRDLAAGSANNAMAGMFSTKDAGDWHNLLHGSSVSGYKNIPAVKSLLAQRGLPDTDKDVTDALSHLYAQMSPGRIGELQDIAGGSQDYARGIAEILGLLPGRTPTGKPTSAWDSTKEVLKTAIGKPTAAAPDVAPLRFNPLTKDFWKQFINIRGVGDVADTGLGVVKAGERVGHYTDAMNRGPAFLNLLKKDFTPEEAMKRIQAAQVNYDPRTFTPTERALKRIFPFYSFSSRMVPYVGKTLTTNPGGGMGQTIRAINAGRDQNDLLPEHIADTAAIPLPAKVADGTKRYLTGLGLMMEDPLSMVGGPRATGLEVLSRLNPLVKGPLEWATGETFFQKGPAGGRSLDDLDPTLGRILANVSGQEQAVRTPQWLEAIIGNSPLTRVATTARQLTDTRKTLADKAVALGSGVRVSDVSPAAQDALLRESLARMEKAVGGKTFTKMFIPDDVKAKMSPAELQAALKMEALMNTLAKRAKERREAKENARR